MKSRQSMSLNKTTRGDMLHQFYRDIIRQPVIDLLKVENELALDIYNMIYGDMRLNKVPEMMLSFDKVIPLPCVIIKRAKKDKIKGSIEPSHNERLRFAVFVNGVSIDRPGPIQDRFDLFLPEEMPQAARVPRYQEGHLDGLQRVGLINKRSRKAIEARYVKGVKEGRKITQPIVKAMDDVTEILSTIKTTSGLLSAWPGCEKYLELPAKSSGTLMKVDIVALDSSLATMNLKRTK